MQDFLQGKVKQDEGKNDTLPFNKDEIKPTKPLPSFIPTAPLKFSPEAKALLEAGKELFKHYHAQAKNEANYLLNAAFYDIKAHFQGFSDKDTMNTPAKAQDKDYKGHLSALNAALKNLAQKLESRVYEYEFLLP